MRASPPRVSLGRLRCVCMLLLLTLAAGCPKSEETTPAEQQRPLAGIKLRLAVVGDPAMAEAIGRLRGEWTAQTGAEFDVEVVAATADAAGVAGDAMICPAWQLGPLAEQKQIVPLPGAKALAKSDADWGDLFELLRAGEAIWGDRIMAVPFGSPTLVCYYRADLLQKLHRRPPQTWAEYLTLAEILADRSRLGDAAPKADAPWTGACEPLAPGWAGLTLLAHAAAYAKHPSNYSTLFNIQTMEPLIDGPAFARALEELAAIAKPAAERQLQADPAGVRAAFWAGECGMAITWPTAAKANAKSSAAANPPPAASALEVGFAALPGSLAVFDTGNRRWNKRGEDDQYVPLLAIAGRLGVVRSGCEHPEAASRLLLWLSGQSQGEEVSDVSAATTLFRRSQLKSAEKWVEPQVPPPAAGRYATIVERTLQQQQWLTALRIPGRAEYLAALDDAVQKTVRGQALPLDALREAAVRWRDITEKLGVERQKTAYLHSLGLE